MLLRIPRGSLALSIATVCLCTMAGATPAAAEPPDFPDLNAFTEAPFGAQYSRPDKWANGYSFFRTPDGLNCMVGSLVQCSGPLPGLSEAEYGDCAAVVQTYEDATRGAPFRFERIDECRASSDGLLDVGQKLTFTTNDTTTCVVGQDRLTACIKKGHGFVVQPSGSRVF